jgi:hypothetical protein
VEKRYGGASISRRPSTAHIPHEARGNLVDLVINLGSVLRIYGNTVWCAASSASRLQASPFPVSRGLPVAGNTSGEAAYNTPYMFWGEKGGARVNEWLGTYVLRLGGDRLRHWGKGYPQGTSNCEQNVPVKPCFAPGSSE